MCVCKKLVSSFNVLGGYIAWQCQIYKLWTFIKVWPYHTSFLDPKTIDISSKGSFDFKSVDESRSMSIIHTSDGTQERPVSNQ